MARKQPKEPWKVEVNDRYQKLVSSVLSLSTAALVLPPLFLKEVLGVSAGISLATYLGWKVFLSWGLLCAAILFALGFYWSSAKWVKSAWGHPVVVSSNALENILDCLFVLMVACFLGGIGCLLWFLVTVQATS